VRDALRHAKLPADTEVSLALVDDDEMRRLNARHRGRDRVTDVLSFGPALPTGVRGADAAPLLEREPDGSLELGDIVIATEQARRQAKRRGWSAREEIAFLAAHGALHLVGYEDDTAAGYREMRRLGEAAVRVARRADATARRR
jgi:probable rRNA maturation factor